MDSWSFWYRLHNWWIKNRTDIVKNVHKLLIINPLYAQKMRGIFCV